MRLSVMRNNKGGAIVMMILLLPLFISIIAGVIWIGQVAFTKIRVQSAVRMAAKAGAAHMAHSLNGIAELNRDLYDEYSNLKSDLTSDSQQNLEAAEQRISRYEEARDTLLAQMHDVKSDMNDVAKVVADATLRASIGGYDGQIVTSDEIVLSSDLSPGQWENLSFDYIEGNSFIDPDDWSSSSYDALRIMRKERRPDAWIGLVAAKTINPIMHHASSSQLRVMAVSAAKAFGGSIACHAAPSTPECDFGSGGFDYLYHSSNLPFGVSE